MNFIPEAVRVVLVTAVDVSPVIKEVLWFERNRQLLAAGNNGSLGFLQELSKSNNENQVKLKNKLKKASRKQQLVSITS